MKKTLNVNVGILGHVDSGKTTLAKALSSVSSTACFDKNPQSRERGITLDLGFSAFVAPNTPQWAIAAGYEHVQFTFVDCPGHASLIRTIMGGAQIIDFMVLVIDVTKGIQTQTAECIVIGEILGKRLLVVLNKVDLLTESFEHNADTSFTKLTKRLRSAFRSTRWPNVEMIPISAKKAVEGSSSNHGIDQLIEKLLDLTPKTLIRGDGQEKVSEAFLMFVDHCFAIKGQGSVLTGTVLRGSIRVNDPLEIPSLRERRKVKSIQAFRQATDCARKGDRVGICVSNLNPELIERTIASAPSSSDLCELSSAVAQVQKVRYYKGALPSNTQMHITVGYETVMATVRYFTSLEVQELQGGKIFLESEFEYVDELPETSAVQYVSVDSDEQEAAPCEPCRIARSEQMYYALLHFDRTIILPNGSTLIGAKLDAPSDVAQCRLMLQGTVVHTFANDEEYRNLHVYRYKRKSLIIDRIVDNFSCIARGLVKGGGNEDVKRYLGYVIHFQPQAYSPYERGSKQTDSKGSKQVFKGKVDSTFGKTGKVKLNFTDPVFEKNETGSVKYPGNVLVMHLKKVVFARQKTVSQ